MAVSSVTATQVSGVVSATIDGIEWTGIRLDGDGQIPSAVRSWIDVGNTPTPYVPTQADYAMAVQSHIDAAAKSRGYADGVVSASYAQSNVPAWAADASALIAWRDAVWVYVYSQMQAVLSGQRAQPTVADLIAELPPITWPSA